MNYFLKNKMFKWQKNNVLKEEIILNTPKHLKTSVQSPIFGKQKFTQ